MIGDTVFNLIELPGILALISNICTDEPLFALLSADFAAALSLLPCTATVA
jgi:hypothetical protein